MGTQIGSDIFVSYARSDRARAEALVRGLEGKGWTVWWDTRIKAGEFFDDVIEAALRDARSCVVLWSLASVKSQWVKAEAYRASQRGILVPVLLDDVELPLGFSLIQAATLIGWSGTLPDPAFDVVAEAIASVFERELRPRSAASQLAHRAPLATKAPSMSSRQKMALIGIAVLLGFVGLIGYVVQKELQWRRSPEQQPGLNQPPKSVTLKPRKEAQNDAVIHAHQGEATRTATVEPSEHSEHPIHSVQRSDMSAINQTYSVEEYQADRSLVVSLPNDKKLGLVLGNIADVKSEMIVRFTDQAGRGRDGTVDTYIRHAFGPTFDTEIQAGLKSIPGARLDTGSTFSIQGDGGLAGSSICQAFVPVYKDDPDLAPEYLARAYQNCFGLADTAHLFRISLPAGGIDNSAFPPELAAKIGIEQSIDYLKKAYFLKRCTFVLLTSSVFESFKQHLLTSLKLKIADQQ